MVTEPDTVHARAVLDASMPAEDVAMVKAAVPDLVQLIATHKWKPGPGDEGELADLLCWTMGALGCFV